MNAPCANDVLELRLANLPAVGANLDYYVYTFFCIRLYSGYYNK